MQEIEELPRASEPDSAWLLVQFGADRRRRIARPRGASSPPGCARSRLRRRQHRGARWGAGGRPATTSGRSARAAWGRRRSRPTGIDHWPGWEDSAVPPARIGEYVRDLQGALRQARLQGRDVRPLRPGLHPLAHQLRPAHRRGHRATTARSWRRRPTSSCSYGGSLSGEHGDGQQRAELLVKQYGPELIEAMREFKRIWDPDWKMNPGKVVDAYRLDENLKLGTDYNPWRPDVRFAYRPTSGDFAHAALRCVGAGKCRIPDAEQVMCPSFQVTREEKHTTRGRARLLFEMLQGEVITDGWQCQGGRRGARPVPGLQGLHERLPGQRRHAHLQGGVPAPPLPMRQAVAPAPRVRLRADRPGRAGRLAEPRPGQRVTHAPGLSRWPSSRRA